MKQYWSVIFLLLVITIARAEDGLNLLRNGNFEEGQSGWFLKGADRCKSEVTLAGQEKFNRSLRLDVTPQAKDMPWSVVLRQAIGAPLQKGKTLKIKVWLRSPEQVQVTTFIEGGAAPYPKTLNATLTLTPQWQEYEIKSECNQDFAPGGANCGFFLSHGKGSVRIGDVRLYQTDKAESPKSDRPKIEPPKTAPPKTETPKVVGPLLAPPEPEAKVEAILANGDFAADLNGWTLPQEQTLIAEVTAPAPGELPAELPNILKLTVQPPASTRLFDPKYLLSQTLTSPLRLGDGLRLLFRARAAQGGQLGVQAGTLGSSAAFMKTLVDISPVFKEYEVRGVCGISTKAGESKISLWNGAREGTIEIAGVRLERVPRVPAGWADAPPIFNLQNLLKTDEFTDATIDPNTRFFQQNVAGWAMQRSDGVMNEVVEAQAGPYTSVLRTTFATGTPGKPIYYNMNQSFRTPPLTGEVFAFKFWARSTGENEVMVIITQQEKRVRAAPGETAPKPRDRQAIQTRITISGGWKEYIVRPDARIIQRILNDPFPTEQGHIMMGFIKPDNTVVEVTGLRLALERPTVP